MKEVVRHGYHTEYPVKTPDDIEVIKYILDHTEFQFNGGAFEIADREFGESGIVQSFYPRSPLQRLIVGYMGFENAVYALNDYPDKIKEFLRVIEEWDDRMYEVLLDSPLEVFSPNLILGISDELPPTADIEKVRLVSKIVEDYQIK